jgi:hypothetical protein
LESVRKIVRSNNRVAGYKNKKQGSLFHPSYQKANVDIDHLEIVESETIRSS